MRNTKHLTSLFLGGACAVAMILPQPVQSAGASNATAEATALVPVKIRFPGGRIAISSDGNQHDKDDYGANALSLVLVSAAGLGDKLVHYDFSDHLGDNNPTQDAAMIESALGSAKRFNLDVAKFFNDQTQLAVAIENFRVEGNKSSEGDPLWFICAGPMEVPWRCINAVEPAKREFIHCISHSGWNDRHGDTPEMTHHWEDLGKLGAMLHHIIDQNSSQGKGTRDGDFNSSVEKWFWLKDSTNPDWQWLYARNAKKTFDVSDAGMTFWLITGGPNGGNDKGGVVETKYLLEHPHQ